MKDMINSRPLYLMVITLCLLLVALIVFWLAAMPRQLSANLKRSLADHAGLSLEGASPQISFSDGIALKLENVSIADEGTASLTAESLVVKARFAALFGGGLSAEDIVLSKAIISLDVSQSAQLPKFLAGRIELQDSSLRLRDATSRGVVSLSDVNGTLEVLNDGSLKADLNFLLADKLTTFVSDVENAERLFSNGSPADVTLSAPKMLVGFSGQAKLTNGAELTGQSNIEADNAAALFRWLGMPLDVLEDAGQFRLLGGVSSQGLTASFDNLTAQFGAETVNGKAALSVGADRTALTGDLEVSSLSLLTPQMTLAQPWSETPLSIVDVSALTLDLKLKIKQLKLRARQLGALAVQLNSTNDTLTITVPRQAYAGGEAEAVVSATAKNRELFLDVDLKSAAVNAQSFFGGLLGFDNIAGPIDLDAKVTMQGNNPAGMISTLAGTATISGKALAVSGADLATQLSKPNAGWLAASTSNLDLNVVAQIKDGIAVLKTLVLKMGSANLKVRGEVDILRQAFALKLDNKLSLDGTWTKPNVVVQTSN